MKEITVHVISVLVVDQNCWLLFARLVCLLLSAQGCLITVKTMSCILCRSIIISMHFSGVRNGSPGFRLG